MLPSPEETWIRAHAALGGAVELVHERPWATVRRVPLTDGVAWFKACARSQAFEPRLTAALAARWPDRLPGVLGHDEERAWLLLADAGAPIGFDRGAEPWLDVLPLYAEIQRGEADLADEHLRGGVPDRRLAAFPALYERLLAFHDVEPLRVFEPRLAELADELAAHGIPETIQHADLHGGNVFLGDATPRILDWGDACVSHPFLTPYVTFLHLDEPTDESCARLRDAYLEPWGPPADLREVFEHAQRLGPFAHAFKELHVAAAIPEDERPRFMPDLPAVLARCVAACV